jgi:hypothetical protein
VVSETVAALEARHLLSRNPALSHIPSTHSAADSIGCSIHGLVLHLPSGHLLCREDIAQPAQSPSSQQGHERL